jgi:hypothetical protein
LTGGTPVNVPVPTIPVVSLTDEQQVALGKAALVRILEGHKTIAAAGGDTLRIALLARLVAQASASYFPFKNILLKIFQMDLSVLL